MNKYLRNNDINIAQYLPYFLSTDPTIKALLNSQSAEHERLRAQLLDIIQQFFVSTATWGLRFWETDLGITTDTDLDIETRRNNIWAKLQATQTSTLEYINKILNMYTTNKSAKATEHNKDYCLNIEVLDGTVTNWDELLKALEIWKPAHIALKFIVTTYIRGGFYFGGLITDVSTTTIEEERKDNKDE